MDPMIEKRVIELSSEIAKLRSDLDSKLKELQLLMSPNHTATPGIPRISSVSSVSEVTSISPFPGKEQSLPSRLFQLLAERASEAHTLDSIIKDLSLEDSPNIRQILSSVLYRFRKRDQLAPTSPGQYRIAPNHMATWDEVLATKGVTK